MLDACFIPVIPHILKIGSIESPKYGRISAGMQAITSHDIMLFSNGIHDRYVITDTKII
jgi:hypothetical protein